MDPSFHIKKGKKEGKKKKGMQERKKNEGMIEKGYENQANIKTLDRFV